MDLRTSDQGKAFISYSTSDKEVVYAICGELRSRGLTFWIDQTEIKAGDEILERVNSALGESKLFIAFVGPNYFRNGSYTSAEFGAAFHKARSADSWRMITIKLAPDVQLPLLAASRLWIEYTAPSETAERILQAMHDTDMWDGPVSGPNQSSATASFSHRQVDIKDVGDRDLVLIVSSYINAAPLLARSVQNIVTHKVELPRGRALEMRILRAVVENESITITLRDLLERIAVNERFVSGYTRQIDEGFLGKFEIGVEIALERVEKKLADATADLRRELGDLVEEARLFPGAS
jgi:hypothetical protein